MHERDIFTAALQIEDGAARAAYLDGVCEATEVRRRVEALLAALGEAGSFLQRPAEAPTTSVGAASAESAEAPGAVLAGRYKLLELIGEGGMGCVWVAEQTEPVRRKVAVKLIKAGMDSRAVLARFGAERQALALM